MGRLVAQSVEQCVDISTIAHNGLSSIEQYAVRERKAHTSFTDCFLSCPEGKQ